MFLEFMGGDEGGKSGGLDRCFNLACEGYKLLVVARGFDGDKNFLHRTKKPPQEVRRQHTSMLSELSFRLIFQDLPAGIGTAVNN